MKQVVVACAVALSAVRSDAQVVTEMTPERIREAIADDRVEGCYPLKSSGAMGGLKFFHGCFTTPYSRVAQAAQDAKKKYAAFTEADVTPEMLAPGVEVLALPQQRLFGTGMVNVEAVVMMPVKSKDRAAAILSSESVAMDSRYQNLLGATFDAKGIVARFPLSVLTEGNAVRFVYDGNACSDWKNKPAAECAVPIKLKGVK
jgi:hypothetical protein